jgi:hypothetical protein
MYIFQFSEYKSVLFVCLSYTGDWTQSFGHTKYIPPPLSYPPSPSRFCCCCLGFFIVVVLALLGFELRASPALHPLSHSASLSVSVLTVAKYSREWIRHHYLWQTVLFFCYLCWWIKPRVLCARQAHSITKLHPVLSFLRQNLTM